MRKINVNRPLTSELINQLNQEAQKGNIIIVFENTRNLKKEDLAKLNSNITISITGGLDPKKEKFNNEHYQERTYYSPKELISIVNFFEKIEREINLLWSELEKCMFVYKKICEYSHYDECTYNGRDAARNLLGLITGKSVCSGYALIFKEAMDRLNIKCYYQNRESHHSWNIVELDGNLHAVELTWDTYNKKDNKCSFYYFCREDKKKFYSNSHHDISDEREEQEYNVKEIPVAKLKKALQKIKAERIKDIPTESKDGKETCQVSGKKVIIINNRPFLEDGSYLNTFIRNDGSSFLLIPTNKSNQYLSEYVYAIYTPTNKSLKATRIYSEMDLLETDFELRNNIANELLSSSRAAKKINDYNGYIGYLEKGSSIRYYTSSIEESLNIHR